MTMGNLLTRLILEIRYHRRPSWDTLVSPPELVEFIRTHPPGRAIDLGCGTGTNVLALVQAGWQVSGIDFAWSAVRKAQTRLRTAGLSADLRVEDVTDLQVFSSPFDLTLDIGCYHQLNRGDREKYRTNLKRLITLGGTFLLYAHWGRNEVGHPLGIDEVDLEKFASFLRLVHRADGQERGNGPSVWLRYTKEI